MSWCKQEIYARPLLRLWVWLKHQKLFYISITLNYKDLYITYWPHYMLLMSGWCIGLHLKGFRHFYSISKAKVCHSRNYIVLNLIYAHMYVSPLLSWSRIIPIDFQYILKVFEDISCRFYGVFVYTHVSTRTCSNWRLDTFIKQKVKLRWVPSEMSKCSCFLLEFYKVMCHSIKE